MSVLLLKSSYSFIDHLAFINKLYELVPENKSITSYTVLDDLFSIKNENNTKISRKRLRESDMLHEETLVVVKQIYEEFKTKIFYKIQMSVLLLKSSYSFIDHLAFINKLYELVPENKSITSYTVLDDLFSIKNENNTKISRKRLRESDMLHEETLVVKQIYEEFLLDFPAKLKATLKERSNTSMVRDLSRRLFESTLFDHDGLNGGNNSDMPVKCEVKEENFLVPPNSRFFCGCVKKQCEKLSGSKFDVLLADPPWWNKFIRRLKNANEKLSYSMMYNEDIAAIPVQNLLSNNCLVAVWCTNAPSNIQAVKNIIFPQWGVKYVTTWYWLKVTVDLEPICPFGVGNKKQPFERLILGSVGEVNVPRNHLMVSIPSALHSHKPPLMDLLAPYIKTENPQILELFARYLLPNTTSVGYEPLKWQHISLYKQCTNEDLEKKPLVEEEKLFGFDEEKVTIGDIKDR